MECDLEGLVGPSSTISDQVIRILFEARKRAHGIGFRAKLLAAAEYL